MSVGSFRHKVIAITGAGSGLGLAVAEAVLSDGGSVIAIERDTIRGDKLAQHGGESVLFRATDVTDAEAIASLLDDGIVNFGSLHGLVNCAGVGVAMKTVSRGVAHPLDAFKFVIDVNLVGSFNCLRLAAERMVKNEPDTNGQRGLIVNTASIAAYDGQIGQVAYAASKGGIVGMTLPAARELAREGIRVMTIAPGLFDTPLLAGLPEEARTALGAQIPFPSRLGMPSEYAALVAHIFDNIVLNGEVIRLDGSLRMAPK